MRRDYFLCVFLACVCASLFFVCFVPNYFTYNEIVVREFGLFERIMSALYAVVVLLAIPVYAAYRKKLWITIGLASYGILALVPEWILPRFQEQIENDEAGVGVVAVDFIFKFIYGMVKAPLPRCRTPSEIPRPNPCPAGSFRRPCCSMFCASCTVSTETHM